MTAGWQRQTNSPAGAIVWLTHGAAEFEHLMEAALFDTNRPYLCSEQSGYADCLFLVVRLAALRSTDAASR